MKLKIATITIPLLRRLSGINKHVKHFTKWIFSTNGLTFTLVLGIFINFVSNKITDTVERQRYQEMLSYEIRNNTLTAGNVFETFNKDNVIYNIPFIKDDVYIAGLNNGCLLTIEPKQLSKITALYMVVPMYNSLLSSDSQQLQSANDLLETCIIEWRADVELGNAKENDNKCSKEEVYAKKMQNNISNSIVKTWAGYYDNANDVITTFNPTKRRLSNPWLRLLMGDEALEFLK